MTFPRARLVVSACLFFGWIGFLLYLVLHEPRTAISKPQFLVASLYVVADVQAEQGGPSPRVTVDQVLWAADPADRKLAGQKLVLHDLPMCQNAQGYHGPGKYLLALMKQNDMPGTEYLIAPLPYIPAYNQPEPSLATVQLQHVGWSAAVWPAVAASTVGLASSSAMPAPLLAASVRLNARSMNRDKMLTILVDFGHIKRAEAETMLDRAEMFRPVVLARRWPAQKAVVLEWKLKTAGATVKLDHEEIRIYTWTPEIHAQVEELRQAKK